MGTLMDNQTVRIGPFLLNLEQWHKKHCNLIYKTNCFEGNTFRNPHGCKWWTLYIKHSYVQYCTKLILLFLLLNKIIKHMPAQEQHALMYYNCSFHTTTKSPPIQAHHGYKSDAPCPFSPSNFPKHLHLKELNIKMRYTNVKNCNQNIV